MRPIYFVISLALHLAAGVLLFGIAERLNFSEDTPVSISVIYDRRESKVLEQNGGPRRARKPLIPLSSLIPKMNIYSPVLQGVKPEKTHQTHSVWTDSDSYDEVSLTSAQNLSMEQISFVKSLWRMIDQYVERNPFLSEYNRTGKVFLQFKVGEGCKLLKLQASAADRVLKVIAARAVRRALKNETGDVRCPSLPETISARFTWSSAEACRGLQGYRGRRLSFCHLAEDNRKSFSAGEKALVWANAIAQHGPWAYEDIQQYNREESRRKVQFDPFKIYELDPDWNL